MQEQSITLNYVEGSSSKTYQCQLVRSGGENDWIVNFQYGRIGSALTSGTKTASPVPYDQALKAYQKLIDSKRAKGYSESASGVAFAGTDNAGRVSGVPIMLLNPISEADAEALICDPDWCCEVKKDGERRAAIAGHDSIAGVNRKGLTVALSQHIHDAISQAGFSDKTVLDGEDMGDSLCVFDVLFFEGRDLRQMPYRDRLRVREEVYARAPGLGRLTTAISTEAKRSLVAAARANNEEGVCFKRLSANHIAGRPASGGDALKLKFVESATVRVSAHNATKRSVGIEVMNEADAIWHFVGNVTIPPNHAVPPVGAIVEVQYLYAYPLPGALFQPVYQRPRSDLDASDCLLSQLKFKQAPSVANAA